MKTIKTENGTTIYIYSHNAQDDTIIIAMGNYTVCTWKDVGQAWDEDENACDSITVYGDTDDALSLAMQYFGEMESASAIYSSIAYDDLSLPAQDAFYNALSEITKTA